MAEVNIVLQLWMKSHVTEGGSRDIYWLVHPGLAPFPPFTLADKGGAIFRPTCMAGMDWVRMASDLSCPPFPSTATSLGIWSQH